MVIRPLLLPERIIDHRETSSGNLEFLVRWEGWGKDDDTWEPRENILDEALIADYEVLA